MKKVFILSLVLVTSVIMTGCTEKQAPVQDKKEDVVDSATFSPEKRMFENLEEVSFENLEIGQRVMIMGDEQSEGIIVANNIIVDFDEQDFAFLYTNKEQNNGLEEEKKEVLGGNLEALNSDRAQRKKMSDAERQEFIEKNGGNMRQRDQAKPGAVASRLIGEVLKVDDDSLVIKNDEGGSVLIMFSSEMKIMKSKKNIQE